MRENTPGATPETRTAVTDEVSIEAIAVDDTGHGVGRAADGTEVHVPDLLPGERGTVVIEHTSRHRPVAWARLLARQGDASPARVPPACPAFGRCGGCAWQHWDSAAQRRAKGARVRDALATAVPEAWLVGAPTPLIAAASPHETGYRNKGKYVVGGQAGTVILGAYAPRSHEVVDTAGCRAVEPAIDAAAGRVRAALDASGLPPYDERTRTGVWRYVVVRTGSSGELLVVLVTAPDAPRAAVLAAARASGCDSAVWLRNPSRAGAILAGDAEVVHGPGSVVEEVAGALVTIGPRAFFQVNRAQAARIYRELATLGVGRAPFRALDLFCGVGGIALHLARAGAEVLGIEREPEAVRAASEAARAAALPTRFQAGDADDLGRLAAGRWDLVAVNPPRKGLSAPTRAALRQLGPDRIAYVSCGPESLARDLAELAADYELAHLRAYDMMPGTSQVETLVILQRR